MALPASVLIVRELPGLAAVEVDDPELVVAGAVRLEEDLLAVRAPARMAVLLGRIGQLPRFLAGRGGQPDRGGRFVAGQVDGGDDVGDGLPSGLICGSVTRLKRNRSSIFMGRLPSAAITRDGASKARKRSKKVMHFIRRPPACPRRIMTEPLLAVS